MENFFSDLKIVELANVLAGPAAGTFFSELGAEVIKIENKITGGDIIRSWKLPAETSGSAVSAYYASVNYHKQVRLVDLSREQERAGIIALIEKADIVLTNYKKGDDIKLGMDYTSLKKINPRLIYGHISGFGAESSRAAFDLVLQAESGFMFMNGTKESGPMKMPVALIDLIASHQLREGILTGLLQRVKTGRGCKVEVSLYDTALASLSNQASNWLMAGLDPQASGSLHVNIAPYGEVLETADHRLIVLAVGTDRQFEHLCNILGIPELASDERFRKNPERVKNRVALDGLLKQAASKFQCQQLLADFEAANVPSGEIRPVSRALAAAPPDMILEQKEEDGSISKRMRSAIFRITE